jgi:predicted peroxiredoxin
MNIDTLVNFKPEQNVSINDPLVIMLTSGPEDGGKRAILTYSAACTSLGIDTPTRVFLVGDGAYWGHEGHIDYQMNGFPPLQELVEMFGELGGETYICSTCDQVCGIPGEDDHPHRIRRHDVQPCGLAPILAVITRGSSVTF